MQVEFEASVWMGEYTNLEEIASGKSMPTIAAKDSDWSDMNYTRVGTAKVVVSLCSEDEVLQNKLHSLNAALQKERAESQSRQNYILEQISKLQALTFEPA